jgi:hypothetical protein
MRLGDSKPPSFGLEVDFVVDARGVVADGLGRRATVTQHGRVSRRRAIPVMVAIP